MAGQRLLRIGEFARLTGLTPKALRHYDAVGVLRPAVTEEATGYRRYGVDQVPTGRWVQLLRSVDMPLDEVRRVIAQDDPVAVSQALSAHHARLVAQVTRLQRQVHRLTHLRNGGGTVTALDGQPALLPEDEERQLATDLFNTVWTYLERPDRSVDDDDAMVHAAHASCHHWSRVGGPERRARGEWQCSRVYAVLDRPEPALHHAQRCLDLCREHGLVDFDLAFAYEALARACATSGDEEAAVRWLAEGRVAAEAVADPEDKAIVLADLDTVPVRAAAL